MLPRDADYPERPDWDEMYSLEVDLALRCGRELASARIAARDTVSFRRAISGNANLLFGENTGPAKITDTPDGEPLGVEVPRRTIRVTADNHGGLAGWIDPERDDHSID